MTKIIYRYERKDIWGLSFDLAEDERTNETLRHVKIAVRCFKKDYNSTILLSHFRGCENVIFSWKCLKDYEDEIVTIRLIHSWNDSDFVTIPFEKLKKEVYALYDKTTGERINAE